MAKKLKSGDKIVFHNVKKNRNNLDIQDITFGKIYHVCADADNELYIYDDCWDRNFACDPKTGAAKWTKIVD